MCTVIFGIGFTQWLNARLGSPPNMGLLIAAGKSPSSCRQILAYHRTGSSICGVTAITALAPAIRASPQVEIPLQSCMIDYFHFQETAFAIATVVTFGTISMFAYPYLAHHLFPHSEQIGMFLGLSIHDTSQVFRYDETDRTFLSKFPA